MAECKQSCSLRLPIKPQQLNNLEGKLKLPVTMELVNMRLKEIDPIHYIRPFLKFLVVPQHFLAQAYNHLQGCDRVLDVQAKGANSLSSILPQPLVCAAARRPCRPILILRAKTERMTGRMTS
jgi:hypothetical protein